MTATAPKRPLPALADAPVWRAAVVAGALFMVLGVLDLAGLWVTVRPAMPEETFGVAGETLDNFPILVLGAALMLAGHVARLRHAATRTLAILCALMGVALWMVAFRYLDAVPYILQVATLPEVGWHVRKRILESGLQALIYPLLLILLAVRSWRATLGRGES